MATKGRDGTVSDPVSGRFYLVWTEDDETLPRNEVNFTSVSGLESSTEVQRYAEGNDARIRKIPGTTDGAQVTLERGVDSNYRLVAWRKLIEEGPGGIPSAQAKKNVLIALFDRSGTPDMTDNAQLVMMWRLTKAWPSSLKISDLNASANELLTQTLVLECDGAPEIIVAG